MTDPQLANNSSSSSTNNHNNNNTTNTNNNNDGEPKYLHKKFKKMATTEMAAPPEVIKKEIPMTVDATGPSDVAKRRDSVAKESSITPESESEPTETRKTGYVCPYCKLSCAKPSVLQKHIRAHTNERPFPCVPCGFAFKTKSNLYKHCRSRAHALKMEGGSDSKVSEDSDISLSDSASNETGTPPPLIATSTTPNSVLVSTKTVKTGKIYKPKFHTALHCVNDTDTSTTASNVSSNGCPPAKPNAEQLQEHIDKIITDNQAIVDAVDPRLHKLIQRHQSLETKSCEQPLNLSSGEETSRKRCHSEDLTQEKGRPNAGSSIIKDLLLKSRSSSSESSEDTYVCPLCKITFTGSDNLEAHCRYYCKGSSPSKRDFQLDLERRDEDCKAVDHYSTVQPLPSPGPLLGNTRLVDTYGPSPTKRQRSESVPTTLRSLEELSKYPRPNSLQMFGGEVRILGNSGETKTMRIEPRKTNSPSDDHTINKCATSETSSIVVRSGLHSGGTMVHKPPGSPANSQNSSISLPNTPKMLAPIIPNISAPNLAPTMSCYNYLDSHLNPLNSITAYNPLTLPPAGIANIFHGGKVIPYVPGMPGPHTLSGPSVDISPVHITGKTGYKVIPGIPGLHIIHQPLDLASPSRNETPSVPGIPGPTSNAQMILSQPLDLASPAKEQKRGFKDLHNGQTSPKIPAKLEEKLRSRTSEFFKADLDRHIKAQPKYRNTESPRNDIIDKNPKVEKKFNYPSVIERMSPKIVESRKRPTNWNDLESRSFGDNSRVSPLVKYESPPPLQENGKLRIRSPDEYSSESNGMRLSSEIPPVIIMNSESPKLDGESTLKPGKSDVQSCGMEETNPKFLRPTSLPLKPGTFTPKRHHGITPTTNTLPLISPETPRPKKSYGQLYLNGHAYTYLGLKCSTRVFYCTLNRPQPMYVEHQPSLSMYSNWKICTEAPSDVDMAHYDSRHRSASYTVAWKKQEDILTHSSQKPTTPTSPDSGLESDAPEKSRRVKIFDGGFESNEDYTYVRGRGRGRYVCEECGIRCKKPSMLKKHIRTHTDVRPYTCRHCSFSFKTKGNLTKHMKSKAHYKKCVELGVTPVPTTVCDENIDKEAIAKLVAGGGNADDSSEEEDETDGEESEESGSEEQEAAQSLLSLSQPSPNRLPGLVSSSRPSTYPYTLTFAITSVITSVVTTVARSASTVTSTAMVQNDVSNRYYFPSDRSISGDSRSSVIRSSKTDDDTDDGSFDGSDDDSDAEMEEIHQVQPSQPMDLTTKTPQVLPLSSSSIQRPMHADILTPVGEPAFLQTIVQTMERLPPQGREWIPEAEGHMLQAYLTERHVMDSKLKQQYRVGPCKFDKKQPVYSKIDLTPPRSMSGTYTDATKAHLALERGKKEEDVKLEMRNERRPFDIESLHPERELSKNHQERPGYMMNMAYRELPKGLMKNEMEMGQDGLQERQDSKNTRDSQSPRSPRDVRTYNKSPGELNTSDEMKSDQELKVLHVDRISPSQDLRAEYKSEHRRQSFDIQPMEIPKISEMRSVNRDVRKLERPDVKIHVEITKQHGIIENMKYGAARKMVVGGPGFQSPSPSGRNLKPHTGFLQPCVGPASRYESVSEDGPSVCGICKKSFNKPGPLRLHMNIHYFERPFKCLCCAVSFRTKGHLSKHERSSAHLNKVSLTSTFGAATDSNPRPFKCNDCNTSFRIHGHLAKHLRSKMHIMKLECLGKLPFGTYAEMERSGVNLNDIDTTDCDNSLTSLQILAQKLYEKDPSKMGQWDIEIVPPSHHQGTSGGETSSDEGEPINSMQFPPQLPPDMEISRAYHMPALINDSKTPVESHVPNSRFEENSLPYKCQMCARSLRTVNELQVHCFAEHNIEGRTSDRGKENAQKRVSERIVREDQGRQKNDDT